MFKHKHHIGKIMKFFYSAALSFFITSMTFAQQAEKELVLYNWEAFMPEQILDEFYQETGYKIRQVYYDSDELKDELIYTTNGQGMDLVIGSGYGFIQYMDKGGILAKVPIDQLPNIKHIDPIWLNKHPKIKDFALPIIWGTNGIIYRKDLVDHDVSSWMDLLQPKASLHNKIVMLDDVRDLMGAALLALGYSINSSNPKHILAAGKLLKSQKPYVKSYLYVGIAVDSELLTGNVHMTYGYNGDAIILKEFNQNIEYVIPKEGTVLWSDHIAVLEVSKNKDMAFRFINFINEPKRAAFLAEEFGSASTNKSAEQFMSQAHLSNPLIYPPKELVEKSEFYEILSGRVTSMYNTAYNNAKQ